MSFLNSVLRGLFDLLMMPFRGLPAWASLLGVSLLTAVLALLVYRRFSDQEALEAIKRKIAASFFEIRLFNDDVRAILRAQLDLLRNNGLYMLLNLRPLMWMLIPMLILLTQLQFHYGYSGLEPGRSAVVTMQLSGGSDPGSEGGERPDVQLQCPEGLHLEAGGVWIPSQSEMAWRIAGDRPGRYELELHLEGRTFTKTVVVSDEIVRRSPLRLRRGFLNQLLFPAEVPLDPELGVERVTVSYSEVAVSFLGLDLPWWAWWLVFTMVLALALRKRFGVTF